MTMNAIDTFVPFVFTNVSQVLPDDWLLPTSMLVVLPARDMESHYAVNTIIAALVEGVTVMLSPSLVNVAVVVAPVALPSSLYWMPPDGLQTP